jgi:hypothetical protein
MRRPRYWRRRMPRPVKCHERNNRLGGRHRRRVNRRLQRRSRSRGLRRLGRYRWLAMRCCSTRPFHGRLRSPPLVRRLLRPRAVLRADVRRHFERPTDAAARSERRDPDCWLRHGESRAIHVPAGFRRISRDRRTPSDRTVTRLSTLTVARSRQSPHRRRERGPASNQISGYQGLTMRQADLAP